MKAFKLILALVICENVYNSVVFINFLFKLHFNFFNIAQLEFLWIILTPASLLIYSLQIFIAFNCGYLKDKSFTLKLIIVLNELLLLVYSIIALKTIYDFIDVK